MTQAVTVSPALMVPAPQALMLVPGLEQGAAPLHIERLRGGTVNDSWRVDTLQGRFVLRVDGAQWRRPGVDRGREQLLQRSAAAAGLAPRHLLASAEIGAQVSEFHPGRQWESTDLESPAQLARLGALLRRLHALPAPASVTGFDPVDCGAGYLRQCDPQASQVGAAGAVLAAIGSAAAMVAADSAGPRILHGDLVHGNLLDGPDLVLIDWEYAQLADPVYDLGCLLAYYPAARRHRPLLLAAAGLPATAAALWRLDAATYVYEALTWLWHLARGENDARRPGWPLDN